MEPKKVKLAITLTVIVALVLILICLCFLFDWIKFPPKEDPMTDMPAEETADTPEDTPDNIPEETPTGMPEEPTADTPADTQTEEPKPGPDDLSGCSDKLYHPKSESYLGSYETMVIRPSSGDTVYLQYKPQKIEYTTDAIMKLKANTVVTALAKENGYTLILVQEGVAGWVRTFELDAH